MSRPMLALLTCAAACSASLHPHPGPTAELPRAVVEAPRVAMDTAATAAGRPTFDLSGAWVTGSTNEPAAPTVMRQAECNYSPSYWAIDQRGDTVRAWTNPESYAQGIATPPRPMPITAGGRITGTTVTMTTGDARYVLRYDAASGHLRGTLNGAPFWAVREQRVPTASCADVRAVPERAHSLERVELSPPPIDSARRSSVNPRVNLTGTWTTGSAYEPTARSAVLQVQCSYMPAFWLLEQHGDTVRAWTMAEQYSKGTASRDEIGSSVPITGRITGDAVTLGASSTRYVLRYDAASGHLRGTLDGAPFWAMRLELIEPEGCLPVP